MLSQSEPLLLRDKIVLVTGALGGIGSEVALAYARQGATIILLDKNITQLEKLYDVILQESGIEPAIFPVDFKGAKAEDYQQLAQTIKETFGQLDGLVHCAADVGQLAPTANQEIKQWSETLQVNLTATFLLTHACLPLMQATKQQSFIIFTTDRQHDKAYRGAYGLSKAAIECFCHQLALETKAAAKIRVNCIDPGQVKTKLHARVFPAADPQHLPEPSAVIPAFLYLASEQSGHLHGQCLNAQQDLPVKVLA
ncbi:SDR family NAD(P)-dependent oxidoreductase [Methylophaga nitratireducenticrescens]|uniref:Short-chain dehydrogenase/reductase SDR n=1 Tax=Methylophaga nitratireducenticrescens TaxID=754476 RepID=I1XGA1_METNJ|nr:SDR family NAD(P)-dependent oxidoreductase [Methylophaga nitratireducenticrescens]AFI83420.1 short-chain dehydrogenase [Methylophaga nitratireducenticrescens]AUZ83526.1 short-chain dehydrogenase [Methylophaga nitratireducenticrescens]